MNIRRAVLFFGVTLCAVLGNAKADQERVLFPATTPTLVESGMSP